MSFVKVFTISLAIVLSAGVVAADNPAYQKGTVTADSASGHKLYNLKAGLKIYQISNCGDFQDGQEVEFLLKEDQIYIAHEGAKPYKCSIKATTERTDSNSPSTPTYMKGTILGYSIRRDLRVSGTLSGATSSARKAKVFELQGPDLVYQIDYCGAFQAGQFTTGQVVEFRLDEGSLSNPDKSFTVGRLYIRHDGNKEYGCQLEGTRKPDAGTGAVSAVASSVAAAGALSMAKLSIASVPDGADIEIDGNFAGNTPSDLEVPEGERTIAVKKSGYKNWERKMKVVAGSSIHLNAEMEKSTNP